MAATLSFPKAADTTPSAAVSRTVGALRHLSFHAMGTSCELQYAAQSEAQASSFASATLAWVGNFEAKFSRFRPTSVVSRISAAAGRAWVAIDHETERMLDLADSVFTASQGILDATALPVMQVWDWKAPLPVIPTDYQIEAARRLVGWKKVQREPGRVFLPEPGMALDFGGFGKEYAVDMVAHLAKTYGITSALVDFGHDIRTIGAPPGRAAWHVGLEDPRNPGSLQSRLVLSGDRGVASSGDYVRCFVMNGKRYGHIVDPRTGRPVGNGCSQATVVAGTCLHAGVLSTTAFVLGIPGGVDLIQGFPGTEGLLVGVLGRAQTRGFYHYALD